MADPRNGGPVRGISKPTFIVCGNETQSTYRKPVLSNIAAFKSVKLVTLDYQTHVTLFNNHDLEDFSHSGPLRTSSRHAF